MAASMVPRVRLNERRFFTDMALSMAAVTFIGFAPIYYLAALKDAPEPVGDLGQAADEDQNLLVPPAAAPILTSHSA